MIAGVTLVAAVGTSLAALASAPSPPAALWVPALVLCALLARMLQVGARRDRRRRIWVTPLDVPD